MLKTKKTLKTPVASAAGVEVPCTTSEPCEAPGRRVVDLGPIGFPEIPVLGVQRSAWTSKGSIFHRHAECMEVTLCLKGSVKFDCNGRTCSLLPGQVFVSYPNDIHRLRVNQQGSFLYWLFIRAPKAGCDSFLELPKNESIHLVNKLGELPSSPFYVEDVVRQSFEDAFHAYDLRGNPASEDCSLGIRVSILRLLLGLLRGSGTDARRMSAQDRAFLQLIRRIRRSPEERYDMDWLVEETHLSPSTISAHFRRLVGLSPMAFFAHCRIRRAASLLSATDQTVTEIAASLNFSSSQHFATRFLQETGMSPTEWRRVYKNAK